MNPYLHFLIFLSSSSDKRQYQQYPLTIIHNFISCKQTRTVALPIITEAESECSGRTPSAFRNDDAPPARARASVPLTNGHMDALPTFSSSLCVKFNLANFIYSYVLSHQYVLIASIYI